MDDDARRLVDHEQVLVLERDPERHLLVLQDAWRCLRNRQLELLAALEAVALRPRRAVDERRTLREQALGRGTGSNLRQRREEAVQPLARGLGGNGETKRSQRERVSPTSSARKRIVTPTTMKLSARLNAGQ